MGRMSHCPALAMAPFVQKGSLTICSCIAVHVSTSEELEMSVAKREQVCASQLLLQAIYNIEEHFR